MSEQGAAGHGHATPPQRAPILHRPRQRQAPRTLAPLPSTHAKAPLTRPVARVDGGHPLLAAHRAAAEGVQVVPREVGGEDGHLVPHAIGQKLHPKGGRRAVGRRAGCCFTRAGVPGCAPRCCVPPACVATRGHRCYRAMQPSHAAWQLPLSLQLALASYLCL